MLELRVGLRAIRVTPHVITEKQGELLGEATMAPYMDVGPPVARVLAEVAFGPIPVVRTPKESTPLDSRAERIDGLERCHGDLDINDRLGNQAWNGCRTDVIDTNGNVPEFAAQVAAKYSKQFRPLRIVRTQQDFLAST